jgi:hypothetical protein
MNKLIFSIVISLYSSLAIADNSEGQYIVIGQGSVNRGKYIEAVNRSNFQQDSIERSYFEAFVQGYLTGVNRYLPDTTDIKGNTDMDGIMAFVEKYCRENPLKLFINGVLEAQVELYPNRSKF